VYLPLGTYANKQGRLAGDSVCGKPVSYDRARLAPPCCAVWAGICQNGLTEAEAKAAGIDCKSVSVRAHSHPHYYPNACEIAVKLCYRESDRVLLGAQLMGERETAIRIGPHCRGDRPWHDHAGARFVDFAMRRRSPEFGMQLPLLQTRPSNAFIL
jgi:NADPH-dependent 2,4-dienoyl-CoA reductase/sulfur reductase-like enzyme